MIKRRITLLFFLVVITSLALQAQVDLRTKSFLEEVFKRRVENLHIYYSENIDRLTLKEMVETLKTNKFTSSHTFPWHAEKEKYVILLTKREKKYLLTEIEKQSKLSWPDRLITNSSVVSADTLNASQSNLSDYRFLEKRFGGRICSFSNPIFIRKGSICFFYRDSFCGSLCGEGNFSIYIKEKGRWVRIITLYEWIS